MQWLVNLQPALVGGVLLWAGAMKLGRSGPQAARRSALARLAGGDRVVGAYRLVGGIEVVVGALLVLPPAHAAEALAGLGLGLGMLGYLGYARLAAPESSCGCLGDKHTPVRLRGFLRAGLLAVAAGIAVPAAGWWPGVLVDRPLGTLVVLVAEAALVVVLSPELDSRWLLPLRRLRLRIRHPLAGRPVEVPVTSSVQQLQRSDAYRSVAGFLRSDLLDSWDEGEWRILTYAARRGGEPATAVFAVPLGRFDPAAVRVALVADPGQRVLA